MAKLVIKRRGGGLQLVIVSALLLPVLVIGFAVLGGGPVGFLVWIFATWMISLSIRESKEGGAEGRMARDAAAVSELRKKGDTVTITERGWSKAAVPLPDKLTTEYTLK